ncbi:hypothetical protein PVK06_043256 [Gossypium arboreum]|uniref:Reverse transcriptase domain-containing protein n=1 Tax=Gossypium arboreum TaxID=29729 RepID=A0ABR0MNF7_GOSAR|nr:hypothetical protein PVK06_043256 [Gossypium arboreum]
MWVNFALNVLNGGQYLESINSTFIVLIPKNAQPYNLMQYRSISLCSVLYKIIAKTMANCLKKVLNVCIDVAQSAFVPNRMIMNNIMLAYEIFHSFKARRLGNKGYFALNLDMSKAHDRVD